MYFPILRGKQNELLALRELLNDGLLSDKILPIIEPVTSSSTFKKMLIKFSDNKKELAVIQNSSVINYDGFNDEEIAKIKLKDNFVPALMAENNDDLNLHSYSNLNKMVIVDEKSEFNDAELIDNSVYLVIEPNNRSSIRKLKNSTKKIVELHDQFNKKNRNVDYLEKKDELFSVEHLYFKEDGYYGFSDYSVIGSEYNDAGFAAKAVAIHLVYFDDENELRIHHFVSDSNEDIKNPALKAHEALEKLFDFVSDSSFDKAKNYSSALEEFKRLYSEDKYSGLGYIKKLSIKHHLEIMGRYLNDIE